jgi:multicomponent Na+:H+ antiporter subunit E
MRMPEHGINHVRTARVPAAGLPGIAWRALLLGGLWWLITQGRAEAWLIGLPAVVLAAYASVALDRWPATGLRVVALPAFLALFLRESIRGGLDVALRTLGPRLRVEPGFRRYRLRIGHPSARVLLINCIGLLPGTLAADLDGDHAELHLLDTAVDPTPSLRQLEQAIAGLFGAPLEADDD